MKRRKLLSGFAVALAVVMCFTTSAFAKDTNLSGIKEGTEVIQKDNATITITRKIVNTDNPKEYIERIKEEDAKNNVFLSVSNEDGKTSASASNIGGVSTLGTDIGGNGCKKDALNVATGCVYGSGTITINTLSADLTFNTIAQATGAPSTATVYTETEWVNYGFVGGNAIVISTINVKSNEGNGIVTYNFDRTASGYIAYSRVDLYGNYRYTNNGDLVQWQNKAQAL